MIIQVLMRQKDKNEYSGKPYSYETELDVHEGDIVIAPSFKGPVYAKVIRINVPRGELDPRWANDLREVCDFAEQEIDSIF